MVLRHSTPHWRVVLFAALRLALLYAVGTALLVVPLLFWLDGSLEALQEARAFAIPITFGFAAAFLVLAVARRAGLVALWVLLAALWTVLLRQVVGFHEDLGIAFLVWSAFAIPLAVLGGLGIPATLRLGLGRFRPSILAVAAALWAVLLLPVLSLQVGGLARLHPVLGDAFYRISNDVGWFIWVPGALVIVALSIAHVWVGTTQTEISAPAA